MALNGDKRPAISTPGRVRDPGSRGPTSVLISIAVHAIVIALLVQILFVPSDWYDFLNHTHKPVPVERIGFIQLPRGEPTTERPRVGGDNRPVTPNAPSAPPVAVPTEVPTGVSVPPAAPPRPATGGAGAVVGAGGDTRGVRPTFDDPRIWAPPALVVTAPKTSQDRIDSAVTAHFQALIDSMKAVPAGRDPGDWTMKIGGQRYGVDQKYIRLGPVSIPTAALALLPLNVQGNPTVIERDRRLAQYRQEIVEQAARVQRDEDFKEAVKLLRERKQKEHDDAEKARKSQPPVIIPSP